MRIVAISDTHGMLNEVKIPEGDILVHAGDVSGGGLFQEIINFTKDMEPHINNFKKVICIAGNHDFAFENQFRRMAEQILEDSGIEYLHDNSIIVDGVKFYGSPYQPRFFDWAFNLDRGKQLEKKWSQIPKDVNVLITHGPPFGILDKTKRGQMVGCEELEKRISQLTELKLHIFGHIHECAGMVKKNNVLYVNASSCNLMYDPTNKPIVVDL